MALKDVIAGLAEKVKTTDKMQGLTAVYQFELSGAESASYYLRFENGVGSISEGKADNPNLTIFMDSNDFVEMVSGRLNPTMAFMSGKLKIQGDMGLAMKLAALLS